MTSDDSATLQIARDTAAGDFCLGARRGDCLGVASGMPGFCRKLMSLLGGCPMAGGSLAEAVVFF